MYQTPLTGWCIKSISGRSWWHNKHYALSQRMTAVSCQTNRLRCNSRSWVPISWLKSVCAGGGQSCPSRLCCLPACAVWAVSDHHAEICVCVCWFNGHVWCLFTVPELNTDGRVCCCLCTKALQAFHCLSSLLNPQRWWSKGISVMSLKLIIQNFRQWEW